MSQEQPVNTVRELIEQLAVKEYGDEARVIRYEGPEQLDNRPAHAVTWAWDVEILTPEVGTRWLHVYEDANGQVRSTEFSPLTPSS